MGRIAFENFGIAAERTDDYTIAASRYLQQKKAEKYIILDIIEKLTISPHDDCLEIGCGTGTILIPISFIANSITGIDHPKCLQRLEKRLDKNNDITLIPGNFLDIEINKKFDKIIIYSVIQYLASKKEVFTFIDKAIDVLKKNGKLLIGDLPNESKERRFLNSKLGKTIYGKWNDERKKTREKNKIECIGDILHNRPKDTQYVKINDALILSILSKARNDNFDSYVVPQSPQLPFGYFREDIIIEKGDL